jgi:hypothetical protein
MIPLKMSHPSMTNKKMSSWRFFLVVLLQLKTVLAANGRNRPNYLKNTDDSFELLKD